MIQNYISLIVEHFRFAKNDFKIIIISIYGIFFPDQVNKEKCNEYFLVSPRTFLIVWILWGMELTHENNVICQTGYNFLDKLCKMVLYLGLTKLTL